ncbi:MAG: CRISPR-associated endonuclease Cas1 [Desulfobulbaceae bacterium]|nr:CRISPR-associated endonuclease Cas1 [Desulfobulbaceae bacterium]
MQTVYLHGHGLRLGRESRHIVVRKDGEIIREIPVVNLKRLLVFGSVQLTTELMHFLTGQGVDVAFFSIYGRYRFRLVSETSKNIPLRLAQYRNQQDEKFCLRFSRSIIRAKIGNQRSLLMRRRRDRLDVNLDETIFFLENYRLKVAAASSREQLMGLEGSAARVYFSGFGRLLKGGFSMTGRHYHPATDPVNALLSFGYSLLFYELNGLVQAHGLDSLLGCYHAVLYGRASLATDIMEEFRAPLIDRLILNLINKRVIKTGDFTSCRGPGIVLNDVARRRFVSGYENFVSRVFLDRRSGMRKNYRGLVRDSVLSLEQAFLDDSQEYHPFLYSS